MEPHSIDPAHDLGIPHHEGVFGPLLWVDPVSGRVGKEASYEAGSGIKALLVWVGAVVVVVAEGVEKVPSADDAAVSAGVRAFLRRGELPIVFLREWLPGRSGALASADLQGSVSRRDLARAAAYFLVGAEWFERERVELELDGERFVFDVRESPDESGRLLTVIG